MSSTQNQEINQMTPEEMMALILSQQAQLDAIPQKKKKTPPPPPPPYQKFIAILNEESREEDVECIEEKDFLDYIENQDKNGLKKNIMRLIDDLRNISSYVAEDGKPIISFHDDMVRPIKSSGNGSKSSMKNGVLLDMTKQENRKAHIKIDESRNDKRCDCLLKDGRGRCRQDFSYQTKKGHKFCATHARTMEQTAYLFTCSPCNAPAEFKQTKAFKSGMEFGCRQEWCKNPKAHKGHLCDCKERPLVEKCAKKALASLTPEQRKHYDGIRCKDRLLNMYNEFLIE